MGARGQTILSVTVLQDFDPGNRTGGANEIVFTFANRLAFAFARYCAYSRF
jgi:hypothetical protein